MSRFDDELLHQEVDELTDLLRHDSEFEWLRLALARCGISHETAMLAGFIEDETGREWGAIVTATGEVHTYEAVSGEAPSYGFHSFERVQDVDEVISSDFPAISAALSRPR